MKINIFKKASHNLKYKRAKSRLLKAEKAAAKAWRDAVKHEGKKHKSSKTKKRRRY